MEETKVIYYIEDDKVPYLVKLPVAPQNACLRDFKKFVVSQGRNFKYYFQTIVEDIGAVKEEKTDDDEKLPIEKDRAVLWLVPIESSLSGSRGDSRSQSSLNELCGPTENAAPPTTQGQFTSMNSVATNSSGSSNNENRANKQSSSNVANQRRSKSNYDSLTRKQSNQQQRPIINTALKDLNFDETSTDTESLVNDLNDLKIMPQGNKQQAKRHQFNSFNNHQQNPYGQLPSGRSHHQQPGVTVHRGGSLGSNTASHHHQAGMANIGGHHGSSSHHYNHHYMGSHPYHKQPAVSASSIPTHRKQSNKQFDTVSMLSAATSEHDTTTFFDSQSEYDDYEDDDEEIDDDDHMSSITGTTATTATSVLSKREKRRKMSSRSRGYNMMMAGGVGASRLHRNNSIHSSVTSLADSTMSLNIITVKIDMTTANFLGISIVGQSNKTGEGGIYVGSIMDGGAVALDGRIEPGDMILQVNEVSFEHMSNDDAVKVLRDAVCKPGPLKLVVAKCWDPVPKGCFQLSKQEPVYPINPSAWVAHTQAALNGIGGAQANPNKARNQFHHPHLNHSVSSFGSTASFSTTFEDSTITSVNGFGGGNYQQHRVNPLQQQQHYGTGGMGGGGGGGGFNRMQIDPSILTNSTGFGCTQELNLTVDSDMELIARAMSAADSGLDIRERNWLKITIPGAFIGSDLVDWLFNHVEGFPERRDARKYASLMLKNGYIRHAVSPMHFSERSYYVFGDQTTFITQNGTQGQGTLFTVDEERDGDFDSVSEYERDYAPMTFAPLQPHQQLPSSAASAASSQQPPGLTFGSNSNNVMLHSHQPKIYSNVGIGGPASDMLHHQPSNNGNYHHSSSSSNVTSNSTSTTSQNTTATTSTSALGGIIAADRPNAPCQLYYPTPITSMNNTNNNTLSNSISLIQNRTNNADQSSVSINETITTSNAVPPPNSFLSSNHNNTVRENSSKSAENRSVKSDNSSSDREELASNQSRVKNESIYIQKSITTNVRSLDKVPKDIRVSKQSFCAAMENPCEFFVDVM